MGFNPFSILKSLLIKEAGTITPKQIEIVPGGTANTKTTLVSSQTANKTLTLPDATDTLVGKLTTDTLSNKTLDNTSVVTVKDANFTIQDNVDTTKQIKLEAAGLATATTRTITMPNADVDLGNLTNANVSPTAAIVVSKLGAVTASRALVSDAAGIITPSITTSTEIGHLNGVTSAIQTQLNAKQATGNYITGLTGDVVATGPGAVAATIQPLSVNDSKIAAGVDAAKIGTGLVSNAEFGFLDGVTSAIQTQLNAKLNLSGGTLTGALVLATDPVGTLDAATKNYVDSVAAGLDPKEAVRAVTTASLGGAYATTPSNGQFTGAATVVDGITLAVNDRVLVKDQVDAKQNGIYVYNGTGQYTRSADMDGTPAAEVSAGNYTFATAGTVNTAKGFVLVGNGILTLNTDNLLFSNFSGAAAGATTALDNLTNPTAINQNLNFARGVLTSIQTNNGTTSSDALTVTTGTSTTGTSGSLNINSGSASAAASGPIFVDSGSANAAGGSGQVRLSSGNNTSGASGAAAVRTGTGTNLSGDITIATGTAPVRGSVILDGLTINASSKRITNVATPTATTDATNKAYVDLNGGRTPNFIINGKAADGITGLSTYVSVQGFATSAVNTATDVITITGHGFTDSLRVQFTNSGGALPAGISTLTDYYIRDATSTTFKISLTNGGTAIDITTQGTGTHSVRPARPVALAGTSTAFVWSTSNVAPLEGTDSFLITVTAGNMGDGGRIPFTIDSAYKASVLSISFDMMLSSGTYANGSSTVDSELIYGIYDVTNGVFIQPSNFKIDALNTNLSERFRAEFQASSNSTSYQLFFHSAYGTNSYVAKVDNISVSPNSYVFGSPSSDSIDAGTMTIGAVTTAPTKGAITTDKVRYVRDGKYAIITYRLNQGAGVAGSGDYLFQLPSGLSIDTNISPAFTTAGQLAISIDGLASRLETSGRINNASTVTEDIQAYTYSTTQFRLSINFSGTVPNMSNASGFNLGIAFAMNFTVAVPIQGWASSVQMADQTSTRVVAARVTAPASTLATTIDTAINFPIVTYDTHGAYSAGSYTVPVSGYYRISATEYYTTGNAYLRVFKNGAVIGTIAMADTQVVVAGSYSDYFVAGDVITIRTNVTTSIAYTAGLYQCKIAFERISGPSQIASVERIAASYWLSANFASSTTVPVNFDSKEFDTHGCVTTGASTWKFTAPISGIYQVGVSMMTASALYWKIYKNGVVYKDLVYDGGTANANGTTLITLNAGDYIDIRSNGAATTTGGALATDGTSHIDIIRIGGTI